MARTSLPPGFRFHPTDVELVCYYLKRKVIGKPFHFDAIAVVDLYKYAPWDLPEKSQLYNKDREWYFLCPRDKKYPNGSRANRTTEIGYWKATGKDRSVENDSRIIGMKKTLIFHVGKPPKGVRTDWVMYEYRLEDKEVIDAGFSLDAYVLCKIFQKSGMGPKIGEQYGAPFNETDWEDDMDDNAFSFPSFSWSSSKVLIDQATSAPLLELPIASNVEVPSDADLSGADGLFMEDLAELLRSPVQITNEKIPETSVLCENNTESSAVDYEAMCNELEQDLSSQTVMPDNICYVENVQSEYPLDSMISDLCNEQYLELNDLSFLEESDPYESLMADCLIGQHPSGHGNNLHFLNDMLDQTSYMSNADTTVSDSLHEESGVTFDESLPCFQIENANNFANQVDFSYNIWNS